MSAKEILQSIIENFEFGEVWKIFREKNELLYFPNEPTCLIDDNFTDGVKLAEGDLKDRQPCCLCI